VCVCATAAAKVENWVVIEVVLLLIKLVENL
jgi:hypothetical protein